MLAVGVAAGAVTPQVLADVITGAGIVGYQSFSSRKGVFVVGMSEVNEVSGLRLSSIRPSPEDDGVSLKFYNGYRWNEAIYALCTDNAYHWISKEEGFLCDDEIVPVGAAIAYELPEGVESLCVAGGIGRIEDAINMATLEMIPKQEMEAEVRRAREMMPKETACIAVITNTMKEFVIDKTILTNLVVVTNTVVPDRFVIRFSDGHTQRAKWSWQLSKAIDPVSGIPMNLNCGQSANGYFGDGEGQRRDSRISHRQESATKDTHGAKGIIDVECPIRIEHRNVSQLSPPTPIPKDSWSFVLIRGQPQPVVIPTPLPPHPNVAHHPYSLLLPSSLLLISLPLVPNS